MSRSTLILAFAAAASLLPGLGSDGEASGVADAARSTTGGEAPVAAAISGDDASVAARWAALLEAFRPGEAAAQGRGQGEGQGRGAAKGREARAGAAAKGDQVERGRPAQAKQAGQGQAKARAQDRAGDAARSQGQGRPDRAGQQGNRPPDRPRAGGAAGSGRGGEGRGGEAAAPALERWRDEGAPGRASARGDRSRGRLSPSEVRHFVSALPPAVRSMAEGARANDRMVAGALARAAARGRQPDAFDVRRIDGDVRVLNRDGEILLALREDRARDLGAWELRRLGDRRPQANAPAFCRSGEGHPVWGREWCLDKGFGLGSRNGLLWSRGGIDDVRYRWPGDRDRVDRGGLIDVLGDIVVGRLALHALSLGLVTPLTGVYVADPGGPRLLRVRSGEVELAEFVDADRDGRAELLYVVQPIY